MPLPDVVAEHYAAQQRQAEAVAILTRRQWRKVRIEDLEGSWAAIAGRLTLIVAAAQLGAARAGAAYVPLALAETAEDLAAAAVVVNANRFAGVASDGRALDSLLYSGIVRTKLGLGNGLDVPAALVDGGKWLETIARTQVADASRGAAGVAIAARPRVGWVRMVSPPCCQRCAVLAGKVFKWNTGFARHPGCDCRHVPVDEQRPHGFTDTISGDQVRDLTEAQRKAVADGADLNQVINAHRKGARSADGMTTSEGTTKRGLAGQRRSGQRLTPDAIYRVSATREEALQRLRDNGYLL